MLDVVRIEVSVDVFEDARELSVAQMTLVHCDHGAIRAERQLMERHIGGIQLAQEPHHAADLVVEAELVRVDRHVAGVSDDQAHEHAIRLALRDHERPRRGRVEDATQTRVDPCVTEDA